MLKRFIPYLIIGLCCSPFLILIGNLTHVRLPPWSELLWVLMTTLIQATASAIGSIILGFIGGLGLMAMTSPRWRQFFIVVAVLPNAVPALFVILAALNCWRDFPFGVVGITFVHILINVGLVAVMTQTLFETKVGAMADLAYLEGASRWQFYRTLLGYLRRDLGFQFLFIFAICFTSFSVPLMVGGHFGRTLEVLIYEKIRIVGAFSEALSLALMQTIFILSLMAFFVSRKGVVMGRYAATSLLRWWPGLSVVVGASSVVLYGMMVGLISGVEQLHRHLNIWHYALELLSGTLIVSFGVGGFTLIFLAGVAFAHDHCGLRTFLLGWVAPSSALTGFALLLLAPWQTDIIWVWVRIVAGIGLITLPALYRLGWHGSLQGLQRQLEVAQVLGASRSLTFTQVVWPQVRSQAFFLAGLAAFWATGEFALSGIVAGHDVTLAMAVTKLMQSYRLEMASALVWLLAFCGVGVFFIFWSLGHVGGQKSHS